MKTVAYMALHYGTPYIYWAIRSVIRYVDECFVLYSAAPSHGHAYDGMLCPDTRDELYAKAQMAAGDKLRWHEGRWNQENEQRGTILELAPHADLILVLDYDEIWQTGLVEKALHASANGHARNLRVPMRHFWRSFHKCVLHDPAYPERVINTHTDKGEDTLHADGLAINHMGYAIPANLMEYKWCIHGHLEQLRHDCNWFRDKYIANVQNDCHPVGSEYWNPESVNPADYLPDFMKAHLYWGMEVIE